MDNPPVIDGRPKRYRAPKVLPKTDYQRLNELKQMLLDSSGRRVVQKVVDIAMDDAHPSQMAALKLCMERTLPVSLFEKDKGHRGAVTINITGIGEVTASAVIDATPEPEDVEAEDDNGSK
jgi:hypothetical protein